MDLVKCGIQMYYEVGVVKKFQVPQEVIAAHTHAHTLVILTYKVRVFVPFRCWFGSCTR